MFVSYILARIVAQIRFYILKNGYHMTKYFTEIGWYMDDTYIFFDKQLLVQKDVKGHVR